MKLRLQAKYNLSISALILAVSAIVAVTLHYRFKQTTIEMAAAGMAALEETIFNEVVEHGGDLVSILSANAAIPLALGGDETAVRRVLDTGLKVRHVKYVLATDRRGRTFHAGYLPDNKNLLLATPATREVRREHDLLVISDSVLHEGEVVGTLRVGFSLDWISSHRKELENTQQRVLTSGQRAQRFGLFMVLAALLLAGVLLGGIMARQLSRPVQALAHSLRHFARDDSEVLLPIARGHDEISDLAAAFTIMRESLGKTTVSRDFLRGIIDSLNEGLIVTGAAGEIHLANRAVSEMFGYEPDELRGKPFSSLIAEPHKLAGMASEIKIAECLFRRRDRREIPVAVSRSVVNTGEVPEHVYVISDITERKRLENELWIYRDRLEQLVVARTKELTAAIHELESFSYSVSHDLHAPLRAINGFGSALHEDYYRQLDESGRNYLDRMRAATVRMGHLIDGLLTLTRVARSEIRWDVVDLSSIASEIAAEIARNEPRRQVTFRIAPGIKVRGDSAHLTLLLQNLFGNAWKFTMKRNSALIEFGEVDVQGQRTFFVRDNGEGFDPVFAQGLFQPFHRLHNDEFPGTGIGLATVQRVVQRHEGEVWAESESGAGATFYFTLTAQVDESRVSARTPLSKKVSSHRPSATAWRKI